MTKDHEIRPWTLGHVFFFPLEPVVFCEKALSCLVALLPSSPAYLQDVGADVYNCHNHFPDP